jgi:hypothetical protein
MVCLTASMRIRPVAIAYAAVTDGLDSEGFWGGHSFMVAF